MLTLLFVILLTGCVNEKPLPPQPPPFETISSKPWKFAPPHGAGQVTAFGKGVRVEAPAGAPSFGAKAVQAFGEIAPQELGYLLVHVPEAAPQPVQVGWNVKSAQSRAQRILGPVHSAPKLFSFALEHLPKEVASHEVTLRVKKWALIRHVEWVPKAPSPVLSSLPAASCSYLVYETGEGEWQIELGERTQKGKGSTVGALEVKKRAPARITGTTPRLFQWAGCPPT